MVISLYYYGLITIIIILIYVCYSSFFPEKKKNIIMNAETVLQMKTESFETYSYEYYDPYCFDRETQNCPDIIDLTNHNRFKGKSS